MVKRLTGFFSWKMGKAKTTPASTKELRRSNSFWKPNQKRECLFPKHSTVARSTNGPSQMLHSNKQMKLRVSASQMLHSKNKRKCTFSVFQMLHSKKQTKMHVSASQMLRKSKRKCAFSAFQMLRSKKTNDNARFPLLRCLVQKTHENVHFPFLISDKWDENVVQCFRTKHCCVRTSEGSKCKKY